LGTPLIIPLPDFFIILVENFGDAGFDSGSFTNGYSRVPSMNYGIINSSFDRRLDQREEGRRQIEPSGTRRHMLHVPLSFFALGECNLI